MAISVGFDAGGVCDATPQTTPLVRGLGRLVMKTSS